MAGAFRDDIGPNTDQGSAYVFVRPVGGWTNMTQTAKLTASDGVADDYLGISVAIISDPIVAGAYGDDIGSNANQGSAYVFVKPEGGWTNMTQTAKLTSSDGAGNDYFGWRVAVSDIAIVAGAEGDDIDINTDQGSAYVFLKPEGGWINMTQTENSHPLMEP